MIVIVETEFCTNGQAILSMVAFLLISERGVVLQKFVIGIGMALGLSDLD